MMTDINKRNARNRAKEKEDGFPYDFTYYMDDNEMFEWIDEKVADCTICEKIEIGKSFEGRPLVGIKISKGGSKSRGIWIQGGLYGSEWISSTTVLYMFNQLISVYEVDQILLYMLDIWDFYFFPLINIDGYNYTLTTDRLWHKTRNTNVDPKGGCVGTDAEKNFDYKWNEVGASSDPCSNVFAGTEPFSEPETKAIKDYILNTISDVQLDAFISVNSYGQTWLFPWTYNSEAIKNEETVASTKVVWEVGDAIVNSSADFFQTKFLAGPAAVILRPWSGSCIDWARGEAGVQFAFNVHLRKDDFWYFEPIPSKIQEIGLETWTGMQRLGMEMLERRSEDS